MPSTHWHGSHWLIDTAAADCTPPASPVLTVNAAGTLATITGSTAGSTNELQVLLIEEGLGSFLWTLEGTRTGDGTVPITLADGYYWGRVVSTNDGGSSLSNLVKFRVGSSSCVMLHSPADIIRRLLIQLGLGVDPPATTPSTQWPVYTSREPTNPDNVITVYNVQGRDDGRNQITGSRTEHNGILIRVRSVTEEAGWAKGKAIAIALDEAVKRNEVYIAGYGYLVHTVSRTSEVLPIGNESPTSQRRIFTINAVAYIRPLA